MIEVVKIPSPPPRPEGAHKGTFGHLLILAGSRRMTGAALLTTEAGLRSGAGLVTLGMPAAIQHLIAPAMLCAMSLPIRTTEDGTFAAEGTEQVFAFADGVSAGALGPGIGTAEATRRFAVRVAREFVHPLVIDADGLNCLAAAGITLADVPHDRVLTPHPGEAARLLSVTAKEVQADRQGAAADLALRHDAVVVLKGHRTIVSDGEKFAVNRTGNPGMATGGTGDVLTGLVGGLLARGMDAFDAALLGAHLHGLAGDLVAAEIGEEALTAADLLPRLGPAFLSL